MFSAFTCQVTDFLLAFSIGCSGTIRERVLKAYLCCVSYLQKENCLQPWKRSCIHLIICTGIVPLTSLRTLMYFWLSMSLITLLNQGPYA